MKHKLLPLFSILGLCFFSCKKDKINDSSILTSTTWKWSMVDKTPSINPSHGNVLYYPVKDCEKDDSFNFGSNGNLTINRGTDQCNENESKTESQKYILDQSSKKITINGTTYTLLEETKQQIKYYATLPNTTGFSFEFFY